MQSADRPRGDGDHVAPAAGKVGDRRRRHSWRMDTSPPPTKAASTAGGHRRRRGNPRPPNRPRLAPAGRRRAAYLHRGRESVPGRECARPADADGRPGLVRSRRQQEPPPGFCSRRLRRNGALVAHHGGGGRRPMHSRCSGASPATATADLRQLLMRRARDRAGKGLLPTRAGGGGGEEQTVLRSADADVGGRQPLRRRARGLPERRRSTLGTGDGDHAACGLSVGGDRALTANGDIAATNDGAVLRGQLDTRYQGRKMPYPLGLCHLLGRRADSRRLGAHPHSPLVDQ